MALSRIRKGLQRQQRPPNLLDYATACASFSWDDARNDLAGLPGGSINIAHEAVDRHVDAGNGHRLALRWTVLDGSSTNLTFADLSAEMARFTNGLRGLGIRPGARVFSLLGRVPELYVTALGTLKAGCVFSPLFSAFGPEPIAERMRQGDAAVLVTSRRLFERKVAAWYKELASLQAIILVDGEADDETAVTRSWRAMMARAEASAETVRTRPDDMALLHFTSGTTGKPKGAVHVHEAIVQHKLTGRIALDLQEGDIFWCTADPGWVTGTSYGILAPLANGVTLIVDQGEFDAERWYRQLQDERVTVWYTAPTAIRMMMKAGEDLVHAHDLSALRFMASVGEPLNPEAVIWSNRVFGRPFHDNWWQTETGGIMIANYAAMEIRPGSMGKPMPGIEASVATRDEAGNVTMVERAGEVGELILRPGWPSMFRGYLHREERYREAFAGGWYFSGDLVTRDNDGYFWFVGRADDVIKSAGHLIGPFEVESALVEHAAVLEAAVIGIPDEHAGEIVKAFVALKGGYEPSEDLRRDIHAHARRRLGPAVAPREIAFSDDLPKTRSGKIMRRLLKARELGLPEGDVSTLLNRS